MIVPCPKCQARYQLEEKQFSGRSEVQLWCKKCQTTFAAKAPAENAAVTPPSVSPAAPDATVIGKKVAELPKDKAVALSVTQGPQRGKIFPVTKPQILVGRLGADIEVDDPNVSRKHCALEVHGSTALMQDLGSANGTFVNEQKIQTCQLEHLSEFRIGATTLMFTVTDKQ